MDGLLVPGDEEERRARDQYRRGLETTLGVLEEAAKADDAGSATWPDSSPTGEPTRTPWKPTPLHGDLELARKNGWLVTPPPDDPQPVPDDAPLAGMTVAVKDLIDVAGLPVRHGTPGGLWRDPVRSAPVWRRLEDAGARCAGKAATHEMAWGVTTPQIGNPHDPERLAGGSSGGSAACVGGGVTHGALGTDTGGSIRIPAALCGAVGLRPTTGTVDMRGITPLAPSQDVAGPIARDVDSCSAMLEVLLDRPLYLGPEVATSLRVGVLDPVGSLDAATAAAFEETTRLLASLGVTLVPCPADLIRLAGAVSLATILQESAALHADAVRAEPQAFGGEARAMLTLGSELADRADLVAAGRARLTNRTAAMFAEHRLDAVLSPTTASVAPPRAASTVPLGDREVPVAAALARFAAWASAAGLPAVSVPATTSGLPVGMQVMAPPHHEEVCLAVARLVETTSSSDVARRRNV